MDRNYKANLISKQINCICQTVMNYSDYTSSYKLTICTGSRFTKHVNRVNSWRQLNNRWEHNTVNCTQYNVQMYTH